VKDRDPRAVGRRFSNATMELALGGYAGFHTTTPPSAESAYGVYWPTTVPASEVAHVAVLPDGTRLDVPAASVTAPVRSDPPPADPPATLANEPTVRAPLGRVCAARSGDKGGNANVGLWTRDATSYRWLRAYLTAERLRELLPEARDLEIRRFELANLHAVNFVITGLLGEGVASSTRPDPQAKGLGEYLRSRLVELPPRLLDGGTP
jgi:hypothetical protein